MGWVFGRHSASLQGSGHQVAFRGGLRGFSEVRVAPRPFVCYCGDDSKISYEFIPKELATKYVKGRLLNPDMHNWVFA